LLQASGEHEMMEQHSQESALSEEREDGEVSSSSSEGIHDNIH